MATIYPNQCPPETASPAERLLFEAFRNGLDRHYRVIHSLPWLSAEERKLREGECDFLVLHPRHGMLAIEAKTGELRYDGRARQWVRGDDQLVDDPFQQAQRCAHYLARRLHERSAAWRRYPLRFAHAVAVPDADRMLGTMPPHVRPELLLMRSDLDHLQARVEAILDLEPRPGAEMPPDDFEQVIRLLLPDFRIIRALATELDEETERLYRLTEEQAAFLEGLEENRRLVVEGVAGSGKTILARELAARFAGEGAVLLLCFNVPLADALRAHLRAILPAGTVHGDASSPARGPDGSVTVQTFHGLCEAAAHAAGLGWEIPAADGEKARFFSETAPELLAAAVPAWPARFDAILVDEGQDFESHWWLPLLELLRQRERGRFYIFHDPRQNVYARHAALPFAEPVYHLRRNCRNTEPIARAVRAVGHIPSSALRESIPGHEVGIVPVDDGPGEREEVRRLLDEWINRGGLSPSRIVILGAYRFERTPYAEQPRLGRFTVVDGALESTLREPRTPASTAAAQPAAAAAPAHAPITDHTFYRFKGLESDCVILSGVGAGGWGEKEEETLRMRLYVAISRARARLYLMQYPGFDAAARIHEVGETIARPQDRRPGEAR